MNPWLVFLFFLILGAAVLWAVVLIPPACPWCRHRDWDYERWHGNPVCRHCGHRDE